MQAPGEATVRGPDKTLIALVTKAHDWFARLTSGCAESPQSIATQEQVGSGYVMKIIYIAFLDPEILRRIVCGDHPTELNANRLKTFLPLPLDWKEQRVLLGFKD